MEQLSGSIGEQLRKAAQIIREGGTVAYPTETVYGIGADATSDASVRRVFACKKREDAKAVSILVPGVSDLRDYAVIPHGFNPGVFFPGPVTLLLKLKPGNHRISSLCISDADVVGFRVSSNPFACELARLCGRPITATSANHAGDASPSNHDEVSEDLEVDALIRAGPSVFGKPSTVFDVPRMRVAREGALDAKSIMSRLGKNC